MKRSPLRRKTALKPGKPLERKTRMKRQSDKRKKLMAEVTPLRDAYKAEFPLCQCGCGRKGQGIHEITAGAARESALSQRETWLHLANDCHRVIQFWEVAKQCALKLIADPFYFNLATINALRGRAENAITMADVVPHLRMR